MPYVTVDVDVDLRQIDRDDLIKELESRGMPSMFGVEVSVAQIFEAFYLGNEAAGVDLTKQWLQQTTGRVLP
ncbi:hypothetical protein LMG24238_06937 [Paraburkholderia sediminicola]|uniref:Uncharacterized protein n=1 Tax=Paraburkholderia sediminicola TaxID=458836 RepID=A0A6J5CR33_9BURK|nr:hypothetical protein [Paraburkholderia sediminicola]CAB3742768.1 hypothetical protein LMG24238_06937 [Paraburkholderia sediminicola]